MILTSGQEELTTGREEPLTAGPEELQTTDLEKSLTIMQEDTSTYSNHQQEEDLVFINQDPCSFIPDDLLATDQDSHSGLENKKEDPLPAEQHQHSPTVPCIPLERELYT